MAITARSRKRNAKTNSKNERKTHVSNRYIEFWTFEVNSIGRRIDQWLMLLGYCMRWSIKLPQHFSTIRFMNMTPKNIWISTIDIRNKWKTFIIKKRLMWLAHSRRKKYVKRKERRTDRFDTFRQLNMDIWIKKIVEQNSERMKVTIEWGHECDKLHEEGER